MDTMLVYFLFSLLAAGAVCLAALYKDKKSLEIYKIVKALVHEAELKLGSGTGAIKYEFVVNRLYSILPSYIKVFISAELLDMWIELAVDELQEMLDKGIEDESRPK